MTNLQRQGFTIIKKGEIKLLLYFKSDMMIKRTWS